MECILEKIKSLFSSEVEEEKKKVVFWIGETKLERDK